MKIATFLIIASLATPTLAEDGKLSLETSQLVQAVQADWAAQQTAQAHLAQDIQALLERLKKVEDAAPKPQAPKADPKKHD